MNRFHSVGIKHRSVTLMAAPLLVLMAACGGDDGGGGNGGADDAIEPAASDSPQQTNAPGDGASGSGAYAAVVIDGIRYEADLSGSLATCISMGGAIGGSGPITGIEDGRIDVDLPPEDWQTLDQGWSAPSLEVDLGEDESGRPIQLVAGGEMMEMSFPDYLDRSTVNSYTIDGSSATGTATFIDMFQIQLFQTGQVPEPQAMQGTFEISCG